MPNILTGVIFCCWRLFIAWHILDADKAGKVTLRQIYEIALVKGQDAAFKNYTVRDVCKQLINGAHTCGIEIVNDQDGDGPHTPEFSPDSLPKRDHYIQGKN